MTAPILLRILHISVYCTKYAKERVKLLYITVPLLAPGVHPNLILHVASDRLANIFLFGSKEVSDECNALIFKAV